MGLCNLASTPLGGTLFLALGPPAELIFRSSKKGLLFAFTLIILTQMWIFVKLAAFLFFLISLCGKIALSHKCNFFRSELLQKNLRFLFFRKNFLKDFKLHRCPVNRDLFFYFVTFENVFDTFF